MPNRFLFQAEDGIRDLTVTGVQTCALPIFHMQYKLKMSREQVMEKALWAVEYAKSHGLKVEFSAEDATRSDRKFLIDVFKAVKIGRASCRERVSISEGAGSCKKPRPSSNKP